MQTPKESVILHSLGDRLAGTLFIPEAAGRAPALVVCHGAGDFKENYFELCEALARRGVSTLALDMHGHGQSSGESFHVKMHEWVADIRAAVDCLQNHPHIDGSRIGAFGVSSGSTAILEAALVDPRLKALVTLDATVRDSLPLPLSLLLRALMLLGRIKKRLTGRDLRIPLAKMSRFHLASDPEIDRKIQADMLERKAFMSFPCPGGYDAFFVRILDRVSGIAAPTLVLWGEDDELDPPESGRRLYEALRCDKRLHVIPGNGHLGHLDRNRETVFSLTADWALEKLNRHNDAAKSSDGSRTPANRSSRKIIEGQEARSLGRDEKGALLSPFLKRHGHAALAYATLQPGMEYFVDSSGYVAYTTVRHPVLARKPKKLTFSDPVCAESDYPRILRDFLALNPTAAFSCISESCARILRELGFKANCLGPETELPIQSYNTEGNWKELDMIKRARNKVRREGIVIREEDIEKVDRDELASLSSKWIATKKVNDREIWIYARRAIFEPEADVRKFIAYDSAGRVVGFAFYDPMYRDGRVFGYSANVLRCDESRFGRLVTAMHMAAMDKFKPEGREVLNLNLSPFVKLEQGRFNDDLGCKLFFQLSADYGNAIYNFRGLSFHKSKYRGLEKPLYFASNRLLPSNDVYLAFLSADITRSYFSTVGRLAWGILTAGRNG